MKRVVNLPFDLNPDFFTFYAKKYCKWLLLILIILWCDLSIKDFVRSNLDQNDTQNQNATQVKVAAVEPKASAAVKPISDNTKFDNILYIQEHYKIGDRIKFYDLGKVVKVGNNYRLSICDIGIITRIEKDHIYGTWSDYPILIGGNWEKVSSNREWKDLVDMKLKGLLN